MINAWFHCFTPIFPHRHLIASPCDFPIRSKCDGLIFIHPRRSSSRANQ
ncbi:hypothetical protein [Klebsiella aerogenes EA1509E]|nr:hypothetical protein [Klebsiella aerogenes EA1509E]